MQSKKVIQADSKMIFILKCLLGAYVVTGGFLLLLALLLYRFQLKESVVAVGIIVIYVISTFLSGMLVGKKMGNRKFLWGLLMGVLYFCVLAAVSLLVNHSLKDISSNFFTTFLICAGSGMLGGMVS